MQMISLGIKATLSMKTKHLLFIQNNQPTHIPVATALFLVSKKAR